MCVEVSLQLTVETISGDKYCACPCQREIGLPRAPNTEVVLERVKIVYFRQIAVYHGSTIGYDCYKKS